MDSLSPLSKLDTGISILKSQFDQGNKVAQLVQQAAQETASTTKASELSPPDPGKGENLDIEV